jgi:hypothetical protein
MKRLLLILAVVVFLPVAASAEPAATCSLHAMQDDSHASVEQRPPTPDRGHDPGNGVRGRQCSGNGGAGSGGGWGGGGECLFWYPGTTLCMY